MLYKCKLIRITHTTTSGTIFTPRVAYPNDGIEFTSGDLFSSLHCCSHLLLVLGMTAEEERERERVYSRIREGKGEGR